MKTGMALLAATLVVSTGCTRPDHQDPGGLAGAWGGGTNQGYRTLTFARGSMTSDQANFVGNFPVEYHPDDSGHAVRVVVQFPDGKRGELHFNLRLQVGEIEDAFGAMTRKPATEVKR